MSVCGGLLPRVVPSPGSGDSSTAHKREDGRRGVVVHTESTDGDRGTDPSKRTFCPRLSTVIFTATIHIRGKPGDNETCVVNGARRTRVNVLEGPRRGLNSTGEIGDLIEQGTTFGHQLPNLSIGVHDGGVVAAAEGLTDLRQG